jgi:hypothetical protein
MQAPPAAPLPRSSSARRWSWLCVLAVLLLVGFIRIRLLDMPLERDEGEYAYAGQLILQGIPPYELAYNMKLPGTYYAYALGMAIFGQTCAGVHLTLLLVNAATIVFVFLLGRKLFGATAGVVACASYGVMAVSPVVLGQAAHANHFVVLFAVPATLLLLLAAENRHPLVLFESGLLYGLAFLMKQQGICFGLFGCLFLLVDAFRDRSVCTGVFLKRGLLFVLGLLLPFGLLCLAIFIAGDFDRFYLWTFLYAHKYAATLSVAGGLQRLLAHLQEAWEVSLAFWLLALTGPLLAWPDRTARRSAAFTLAFWGFSFAGTAIGWYFRSHYFILLLPAFALLIGLAVVSGQRILVSCQAGGFLRALPLIFFAVAWSWALVAQAPAFFRLSPAELCHERYRDNPFLESLAVAGYIRDHSTPDARIAVLGSEPEIFFYAHRHSATGYIYTYALMEHGPAAPAMQRDMIQEIETNRPDYIVYVPYHYSWLGDTNSDQTIFHWLAGYLPSAYQNVGLVGFNDQDELVSVWADAATGASKPVGEYIRVYRRISPTNPARAN